MSASSPELPSKNPAPKEQGFGNVWVYGLTTTVVLLGLALWYKSTFGHIQGQASCPSGEPVEGVWVSLSNPHDSGWAHWWLNNPNRPDVAQFKGNVPILDSFSSAQIDVGCGGNTDVYNHNDKSPFVPIFGSKVLQCADIPNTRLNSYNTTRLGSCSLVR